MEKRVSLHRRGKTAKARLSRTRCSTKSSNAEHGNRERPQLEGVPAYARGVLRMHPRAPPASLLSTPLGTSAALPGRAVPPNTACPDGRNEASGQRALLVAAGDQTSE